MDAIPCFDFVRGHSIRPEWRILARISSCNLGLSRTSEKIKFRNDWIPTTGNQTGVSEGWTSLVNQHDNSDDDVDVWTV